MELEAPGPMREAPRRKIRPLRRVVEIPIRPGIAFGESRPGDSEKSWGWRSHVNRLLRSVVGALNPVPSIDGYRHAAGASHPIRGSGCFLKTRHDGFAISRGSRGIDSGLPCAPQDRDSGLPCGHALQRASRIPLPAADSKPLISKHFSHTPMKNDPSPDTSHETLKTSQDRD